MVASTREAARGHHQSFATRPAMDFERAACNVSCCLCRVQLLSEAVDELPDGAQDGLLIASEGPVIRSVEFDEPCPRDVAGEIPARADANGAVVAPVEHQSGHRNLPQKMPHVHVAQRLEHALDGSGA